MLNEVKTAYNYVSFNKQLSIITNLWIPYKDMSRSNEDNQGGDGSGLLCLLHNNRIFAFKRKNKPQELSENSFC